MIAGRRTPTVKLTPKTVDHRADQRQHGHRAGVRLRGQEVIRCILTMPETHEPGNAAPCWRMLGAKLVLTPAAEEGMKGAIARADALAREHSPMAFMPQQFSNPGQSRKCIADTTAEEIWADTDGRGGHPGSPPWARAGRITGVVGGHQGDASRILPGHRRRADRFTRSSPRRGVVNRSSPARTKSRGPAPVSSPTTCTSPPSMKWSR